VVKNALAPTPLEGRSKYFFHIKDQKTVRNVDFHGEVRDQGIFKELIVGSSDDLYVGVGWLKPGEIHILHHHPDASEFYFVLKGVARITVGDETIRANQGTACYIPVGTKHKIVNDSDQEFTVLFGYNRSKYSTIRDE
jgi:oxalate decarboxylase/phosphoglucose isomerase-like protein (cupin superfamily)